MTRRKTNDLVGHLEDRECGEVVDCAPDFPLETAAYTVSTLVKMYPKSRRTAAGRRIIEGVEQQCGEWVKVLQRVVGEAIPSGKRTRKRR